MFTFLSMNILVFSQTYLLNATTNNTTINTCGGNFYDSGGAAGQYTNNQNYTVTFCPSTPGAMLRLNFSAFALENSYDFLYIYNGNSTAAPLLGTYTGTTGPGVVTANNPSGCITIRFTSDGSVLANGWAAAISCIIPTPATCSDGIQNQGEVGIDCGGPCPVCTNFLISTGGTVSACNGTFYDSGGAAGQYANSQNQTMTICPSTPGAMVQLNFTSFATENGFDNLRIYNGSTNAAPQVVGSPFSGTVAPGLITASNPSGCLTINFTSDGSVLAAGWAAAIS
jgi:hypothetical protein